MSLRSLFSSQLFPYPGKHSQRRILSSRKSCRILPLLLTVQGEYFELYNAGDSPVDMNGWTIADNDSDSFVVSSSVILAPGAYAIFANNGDSGTNGGFVPHYVYGTSMFLANGADELVLFDTGLNEIDRVEYDGGPVFPDPNGASMSLIDVALDNNVGANWCEASTPYGAGDLGTPGSANDCVSSPPNIIITEIMQNPSAVADGAGEYFELYNAGDSPVDMNGWTIADNDSDSFVVSSSVVLAPGAYAVFANNGDSGTNGGFVPHYVYGTSMFLANGADELVLFDTGLNEIDRVEYDGGPVFPDPNGASMSLIDVALDNNVGANWCEASTPYGAGDLGTPGSANDCVSSPPNIIITEIMQNPSAVADGAGEYFELYNAGDSPVDMNGWTIADNDSDSFVVSSSVVLAPGAYAVFANNGDSGTNGGFVPHYVYGTSMFLANGADELVLFDTTLTEIDRVEYDGGPVFPDPNGASMSLIDVALDNNVGANWCEASTPYGAGDLGTPSSANDCAIETVQVYINELRANKSGAETDFFEIQGEAGTSLNGLTFLVISGEFNPGQIDSATDLSGSSIPADGFFVAMGASASTDYGITPDLSTEFNSFGSPATYMIVSGFSGSAGNDLDTNDDGVLENTPWTSVVDSVSLIDGDSTTDFNYSAVVVGPDGSFAPAGTYRCDDAPAGTFDNNQLSFDTNNGDTPGITNESLCVPPLVSIHDIQGTGNVSPLSGTKVTIQAVVVGDFQESDELGGIFIQEEAIDEDGNPLTSEGIFVFCGGNCPDVSVGNTVSVSGTVSEFSTSGGASLETQLSGDTVIIDDAGNNLMFVAPAMINFPVASVSDLEAYEGMSVRVNTDMYVTEYFNFDRFGEILVWNDGSGAARPFQPTQIFEPGSPEAADAATLFQRSNILLDDGSGRQNFAKTFPQNAGQPIFGETIFNPGNPSAGFRGGDIVTDIEGVMAERFGQYRIQIADPSTGVAPDGNAFDISITNINPRNATPDNVGGNVTVASFNVLNYFTTIDTGAGICGANQDLGCRGADTPSELTRQQAKIVAALVALDADVVGLIEIESTTGVVAEETLVNALNAVSSRTYSYINTGPIGTDAIKVALIYDVNTINPSGNFAIMDSSIDPAFVDTLNRPALIQTFEESATGGVFTVAVNHLKSKGSSCGAGDDDPEQGNCNLTRTNAAIALANYLATDPTGSGDADFLIIGDLNSYAMEDPIAALNNAGYIDLAQSFIGSNAYGYLFSGQWGTLDYAMANVALTSQVTGVTEWHINADEPDILDYDESFNYSAWYEADGFRASDHDPVLIGLDLEAPPTADLVNTSPDPLFEGETANLLFTNVSDPNDPGLVDEYTYAIDCETDGAIDATILTDGTGATLPCTYTMAATYDVIGFIRDKTGLISPTNPVTITVITTEEAFAEVSAFVGGIDTLNNGQRNAMMNHLDNALRQYSRGQLDATLDQLNDMFDQVQELAADGIITEAVRLQLSDYILRLIVSVSA